MAWQIWSMQAHHIGATMDGTAAGEVTDGDRLISFRPTAPADTVLIFSRGALVQAIGGQATRSQLPPFHTLRLRVFA